MNGDSDGRHHDPPARVQPARYAIRIADHLETHWSEWFGGLAVTHPNDVETLLCGPVVDQAALHGLLVRVRDMNLTLLSVQRL
jgi:hypothetical protein